MDFQATRADSAGITRKGFLLLSSFAIALSACSKVNFAVQEASVESGDCIIDDQGQCSNPPPGSTPPVTSLVEHTVTVQAAPTSVDVLVVLDNSGSMAEERKELGSRLKDFTGALGNLDWKVCMTTTDRDKLDGRPVEFLQFTQNGFMGSGYYALTSAISNYNQLFLDTAVHYPNGAGDEEGIFQTNRAIQRRDSRCFRDDAALAVVLLSDEDERSTGGYDHYRSEPQYQALEALNQPESVLESVRASFGDQKVFNFHSIVIPSGDQACFDQQKADHRAYYGTRYEQLSNLTGGIIGSICSSNYATELTTFAERIKRHLDAITLKCAPVGAVSVNVSPQPAGLSHVVEGNKVKFTPSLNPGTVVTLKYYCQQ